MIAANRRPIFGGVMVRVVGMELPAQPALRPELIHIGCDEHPHRYRAHSRTTTAGPAGTAGTPRGQAGLVDRDAATAEALCAGAERGEYAGGCRSRRRIRWHWTICSTRR